ncbi:doublecortin domain-containing protein 2C isoform 2-T2 [Thomomys bottae]
MGTRGPHPLVDTTPAKTILVYRNGDQFYVGRRVVVSRRRVASFEALLEQLTEQVEAPFGVRRLYTPSRGRVVCELDALQSGGNYVHIVPRKPAKMRKLKEIKPVVHCDINVPSRWQTYHRMSRHINVFTNGRLFIPPVKVIIPKFSLSDWNCVLATVGDKVFPLGGVRKLYTLTGHLLGSSQDLQDNQFYIAAGLESFKSLPYWKCPRVPSEVQQRYMDVEKLPPKKKKVEAKGKEPPSRDTAPPKTQESVYYAKEGPEKKMVAEPPVEKGAEGDVYKARTPTKDAQGAQDVREDPEVKVEVPVDQAPAEIVKEEEAVPGDAMDAENTKEKEDGKLGEEVGRKGDSSRVSFKKKFPLRHNTKKTDKRFISWIPQILKYEGGTGAAPEENAWAPDHCLWPHKSKRMLRTATRCRGEHVPSLHPKDLVVALDLMSRGCASAGRSQGFHVLVASLKNLSKNKEVVPIPEKEQHDIIEGSMTPELLSSSAEAEEPRASSVAHYSQDEAAQTEEESVPSPQDSPGQISVEQPLQEETPGPQDSSGQPPSRQSSSEEVPGERRTPEELSAGQTS